MQSCDSQSVRVFWSFWRNELHNIGFTIKFFHSFFLPVTQIKSTMDSHRFSVSLSLWGARLHLHNNCTCLQLLSHWDIPVLNVLVKRHKNHITVKCKLFPDRTETLREEAGTPGTIHRTCYFSCPQGAQRLVKPALKASGSTMQVMSTALKGSETNDTQTTTWSKSLKLISSVGLFKVPEVSSVCTVCTETRNSQRKYRKRKLGF